MTTTTSTRPPFLLAEVGVTGVDRLSPTFLRIELGGSALVDFGVAGPLFDQRIKLILPGVAGVLPRVDDADENWLARWQALPASERGHMRTYTAREAHGSGEHARIVVDFALHQAGDLGPGSRWAMHAHPGDRVVLLGPRRDTPFGGIEFTGIEAERVLLVGDETALPAIAGILRDLPPTSRGDVVIEIPTAADVLALRTPDGVRVHWCPRAGSPRGSGMREVVQQIAQRWGVRGPKPAVDPVEPEVDPDLWETPTYSSSGCEISAGQSAQGLYAWIAGEASVVTGLRRYLVTEIGLHRSQVAFMGYWREGVAMRS